MSFAYTLLGIPGTREEIAQYAQQRQVPVAIQTSVRPELDKYGKSCCYVADISTSAGRKRIRERGIFRTRYSPRLFPLVDRLEDYRNSHNATVIVLERALARADSFAAEGVPVTVDGRTTEEAREFKEIFYKEYEY